MDNLIKSKIKQFLLVTFSISLICFGIIIISNRFGYLEYGTPLFLILFVIAGNAAPISSYVLLKKWNEVDGIKSFFKQSFNLRSSVRNYALITGLLIVHFGISVLLRSTGDITKIYLSLFILPMSILFGGLEEIGWRGIVQYNLEKLTSFFNASFFVAILWGIWHAPFWFIEGTVQSTMSFSMFFISICGITFLLGAIRRVTDSVWLCILFHSLINSITSVLVVQQGINTILTMIIEISLSLIIVSVSDKKIFYLNKNFNKRG